MAKDAPYQFYLEPSLKAKGKHKAKENNVTLAPFMTMAWEQFLERPIEESMRLLKAHQQRMKQKLERPRKKKYKGVKVTL